MPVRIIWGEEDAWLDPALARRIGDMIARAEVLLVRGAGHFVMEDAPAAVANALDEFFAPDGER